MTISILAAFWLVSFLLVLVPGADWAYVIAVGLRDRSIVPAVGGVLLGYVLLTAVVAAGVAALVARSPAVLTVLMRPRTKLTCRNRMKLSAFPHETSVRRPAPVSGGH